jgi:hypothetical protein
MTIGHDYFGKIISLAASIAPAVIKAQAMPIAAVNKASSDQSKIAIKPIEVEVVLDIS